MQNQLNQQVTHSRPNGECTKPFYYGDSINAVVVNALNDMHGRLTDIDMQIKLRDTQLARKRRKRNGRCTACLYTDNYYYLIMADEDGETCNKVLFTNSKGEFYVYRIYYPKYTEYNKKFVAVVFSETKNWVCLNVEKLTEKRLYDSFIAAGVKFDLKNTSNKIKEALWDLFAEAIANIPDGSMIEVNGTAGWNNGKWEHSKNFTGISFPGNPELPVMNKYFCIKYSGKELLEKFWRGISSIENRYCRIVMLEMIVSGVLASLFQDAEIYSDHFLNFVLVGRRDKELFCHLYQVFNRGRWQIQEASDKEKVISDNIRGINDEILIVNMPDGLDAYGQRKSEKNLNRIVNKICRRDCSSLNIPWKVNASLVVLNEFVSDLDSAINIIADECIFTSELTDMLKGNAVDAFLYELVTYVEAHMAEVRAVIKKWSSNQDGNMSLVLLKAIWEILSEFARDKSIDLAAALGIPGSPDWGVMWRSLTDRQEMGERMVKAVRSSMSKFYVKEKYFGCRYVKDSCYYDNEYFWIPIKVFKEIMKTNCISSNKYRETLVKWKQQELLLPDESGLTYKLRVDGAAIQTYRFRKALFDQPLFVPIEGRGKDEEHESEKGMRVVWHPQNSENYKQCKH